MAYLTNFSGTLPLDIQNLESLRYQAKEQPEQALKSAAKQFEALFLNMVLKSMRETIPQTELFNSDQTRLYTSLLDQQLSQTLSARGLGLADLMVKQLSRTKDTPIDPIKTSEFVNQHWQNAQAASRVTGIPTKFILGQAALESGWGQHEIYSAEGKRSHNLFGIKAGADWSGPVANVMTTEYVNGVAQKIAQEFRAYGSYLDAFQDYARLLKNNPRYATLVEQKQNISEFAHNLQKAGYATDPQYAEKLIGVINHISLKQKVTG